MAEISWQGCPFLTPHAQHSPSAPQSTHWVCYSAQCPTERPPGAISGRNVESQGAPVLGEEDHHSREAPSQRCPLLCMLKCQQWVKSFQWTVKQHLHNKTAALFPNQMPASMYRGNCVPKHEGQLIWKFILVFSNLPVCLQICWEQINNTDSSYMQKFDIPKQKQQQKNL